LAALREAQSTVGFADLAYDDNIGKLSVVGGGMRTNAGVSAQLFTALFEAGINMDMISTSEIRISVITRGEDLNRAVSAVHTAFGLDGEVEAIVYAGTGR
jgi:aspartate kinase